MLGHLEARIPGATLGGSECRELAGEVVHDGLGICCRLHEDQF
jgi:hypothetical protein